MAALGAGAWALTSSPAAPSPPRPTPTASPGVPLPPGQEPPAGWATTARWSIEDIADIRPVVSVRNGLAIVVRQPTGTGRLTLTAFDPATGKTRWEQPLPAGEIVTDGPFLLTMGGKQAAFLATETATHRWDAPTGKNHRADKLPRHAASVGVSLLGPWINEKGKRFLGLTSKGPKPFDLPDKTSAFGLVGDRMLVATPDGKAWLLEVGKPSGKPIQLSGIKDHNAGAVVAVTDTLLIIPWLAKDQPRSQLRAYDVHDLKGVKWTTRTEANWQAGVGNTLISPDQSWATIGNRAVDLTNGDVHAITGKWQPRGISNGHAWGSDGTDVLTCTKDGHLVGGKPAAHENTTLLPCGGTKDLAILAGSIGPNTTLYGVLRA